MAIRLGEVCILNVLACGRKLEAFNCRRNIRTTVALMFVGKDMVDNLLMVGRVVIERWKQYFDAHLVHDVLMIFLYILFCTNTKPSHCAINSANRCAWLAAGTDRYLNTDNIIAHVGRTNRGVVVCSIKRLLKNFD